MPHVAANGRRSRLFHISFLKSQKGYWDEDAFWVDVFVFDGPFESGANRAPRARAQREAACSKAKSEVLVDIR